jgi:hypothetical protein
MTGAVNNAILVSPQNVHQAVHGRHKILDAVEAAGILQLPDVAPYADEVVAVLDALSPAHNETILRALETALNEGETAMVFWVLADAMSVEVASVSGGIVITLRTKDGRQYLGS